MTRRYQPCLVDIVFDLLVSTEHMLFEITLLSELFAAYFTKEWFCFGVNEQVLRERRCVKERLFADWTVVGALLGVMHHVGDDVRGVSECFV